MEDPNTPVVCRSCGRSVPMREIKFDANNKIYVCNSCYNASMPPKGEPAEVKPLDDKTAENLLKKMIKYNCPKCKYHFSRVEGREVKECPYCGNLTIEVATSDNADKLVQGSEEWE